VRKNFKRHILFNAECNFNKTGLSLDLKKYRSTRCAVYVCNDGSTGC